ncbi:MAG: trypsin-like peptidase domain-containing protein [Bdellovibrionales bacterium]|nr:trypsin-like peptidase domain-containing protein [Bdellovibrionales bacterium]
MKTKRFINFSVFLIFCVFYSESEAVSKESWPSAVIQAEAALFKIKTIYSNPPPSTGTGFAVQSRDGRKFIVTARHNVLEVNGNIEGFSDLKNVEIESAQTIEMTHWKTGRTFTVQQPTVVSFYADLALMEVPDYTDPVIQAAYFDKIKEGSQNYMMGFAGEEESFYGVKVWNTLSHSKSFMMGVTYPYIHRGASGSPLFNKDGRFVGVMYASHGPFKLQSYFVKSNQVQELLKLAENIQEKPYSNQFYDEVISIKDSSESGDSEAQFLLSQLYRRRFFNNLEEADKWHQEAAKNGNLFTVLSLAIEDLETEIHEKTIPVLKDLAKIKLAEADYILGNMSVTGEYGSRDLEEGLTHLNRAVDKGYPLALLMLGGILTGHNKYVPFNEEKTSKWWPPRLFSRNKFAPPRDRQLFRLLVENGFSRSLDDLFGGQRLLRLLADRGFSRNLRIVRKILEILSIKGYSHDIATGTMLLSYLIGDDSLETDVFQSLSFLNTLEKQGFVPTAYAGKQFLDVLKEQGLSHEGEEETVEELKFMNAAFSILKSKSKPKCRSSLFSSSDK